MVNTATTATPTNIGKCGKVPAGNIYKLGVYNGHTTANVAAWQAVQVCIAANGGTATAQQIANALAGCTNITSNLMLAYLLKPSKAGPGLVLVGASAAAVNKAAKPATVK